MTGDNDEIVISKRLDELMRVAVLWLIRKIEAEEPFSAIVLSEHPSGRKGTLYQLDSVEEAFAKSEEDLKKHLSDAERYALVFDAWLIDVKRTPVIICRVEEQGMKSQYQFALPYEFDNNQQGKSVKPTSDFQFSGTLNRRLLSR